MDEINQNIAENITKLRKINNLKQTDLAEKINYSDKAISKWERGDSVPDVECLCKLASVFNVTVDYLTKSHNEVEISNTKNDKRAFLNDLLTMILLCVSVLFISTIAFVFAIITSRAPASKMWVSYVIALPIISCIVALYGKRYSFWLVKIISSSLVLWTLLTAIYCISLINGIYELWMLYFIGLPIQAAICLISFRKKIK